MMMMMMLMMMMMMMTTMMIVDFSIVHGNAVNGLSFHPSGNYLVTASNDTTLKVSSATFIVFSMDVETNSR